MSIVSISIVVYKPDLSEFKNVLLSLKKAIDFCYSHNNAKFEICIIDNSVVTTYADKIRYLLEETFNQVYVKTDFISSGKNIGYGGGHNLMIKGISTDYHLVLNPDVFLKIDSLFEAVKYMEDNLNTGLLTPSVCGSDGARHYLCKKNPTIFDSFLRSFAPRCFKKIFQKRMEFFEMRDRDYNQLISDVPFPSGCFMFFRTSVLKQLNGFDDDYFMYFEDADNGRRLLMFSHSSYVPEVKIMHVWARGSHRNIKLMLITIHSAWKYWRKWGGLF